MRTLPHAPTGATFNAHRRGRAVATSATMGRPKIAGGLVKFNLQLVASQKAELEAFVERERERRDDPALTLTDVIREACAQYLAKHAKRKP